MPDQISTPAVLLLGPSGTGKTYSLPTLVEAGLETFVLITEPRGVETLVDSMTLRKLPMDKLHWHYTPPASPGWSAMMDMSRKISNMGYEDLSKLKSGIGKDNTQQFIQFLNAIQNFPCDRTGDKFGDVTEWGADRAFVVDSLSGLSIMAMDLTIGYKPAAHQGEWGVAMNMLEKIILKLTSDMKATFVLTAHIEREVDDISGGTKIGVSTLGRKLAPKLPRFFSEAVLTVKEGNKFSWSTSAVQTDLKNRSLPLGADLSPSFIPIVEAYHRRLKAVKPAVISGTAA